MSRESATTIPVQQELLVGGVNTSATPDRIKDSEILRSQNMRPLEDKLIQVPGFAKIGNNQAFNFATDEGLHITDGNQTGLDFTGDMTVEVLFKTHSAHSGDRTLVARYDGVDGYRLYIEGTGDVIFEVEDAGGDIQAIQTTTALTVSTVYIAKATFTASSGVSTLKIYTDATTVQETVTGTDATVDDVGNTNSNETTIGMNDENAGSFGDFFTGLISYVRIQDAVEAGVPDFTDASTDVKGLWRSTLNGTPELIDHSGNANDMASTNIAAADITQLGRVVPPLLGVPLSAYDITFASNSRTTVIHTTTRFYAWDTTTAAWQDYGTDIAFAGDINSGDFTSFDDIHVITNLNVQPQKWAGSAQITALSSSLGSTYLAKIYRTFGTRGHFFNVSDGGTTHRARHQWSAVGDIDSGSSDWDKVNDNTDLDTTVGQILNALQLGDNMFIYKDRGPIIQMSQTGIASPPFSYRTVTAVPTGLGAERTLVSSGRSHYYLGVDNVYRFDGRTALPIGDKVLTELIFNLNPATIANAWGQWDPALRQYYLWVPQGEETYPAQAWIFDERTSAWNGPYKPTNITNNGFTLGGFLQESDDSIWSDIDISWSEADFAWSFQNLQSLAPLLISTNNLGEVFKSSTLTGSFDGGAIESHIITRDFKSFNPQTTAFGVVRWLRVEVAIAGSAGAGITLEYSTDSGDNWSSTQTAVEPTTFDNNIKRYMFYIDVVGERVRFRIGKTAASSSWLVTRVTPRGRFVGAL